MSSLPKSQAFPMQLKDEVLSLNQINQLIIVDIMHTPNNRIPNMRQKDTVSSREHTF